MKKFLASKKVKAMIVGLIINTIVAILTAAFHREIPPNVVDGIAQIVTFFYGAIPSAYMAGQAYADGKSGGATSSTPPDPIASARHIESLEIQVADLTELVEHINKAEYSVAVDDCESTDTVKDSADVQSDLPRGKMPGNRKP